MRNETRALSQYWECLYRIKTTKKLQLTQNAHITADGLDHKGGGFTHNASLQTGTPGPDLLRPRLWTDRHFERTDKIKNKKEEPGI